MDIIIITEDVDDNKLKDDPGYEPPTGKEQIEVPDFFFKLWKKQLCHIIKQNKTI